LCLLVGLQTVRRDNYFLGDDFGLVQHLHDLPPARLLTYFVSDWTEGAYGVVLDELRPVLAFSYWLDAHMFGASNAAGYHATNVILHILNVLLVLAIARSITPHEPRSAVLAASVFALMPSHAEPIAWISGRVDSLASLFYLGAFLCFVRFRVDNRHRWLLAAVVVFAFGLFAKQSMVTLPVLLVACDWFWFRRRDSRERSLARLWVHVPFFLLAASYLALRYALFGEAVRESLLTTDTIVQFIRRQATYGRMLMPTSDGASANLQIFAEILTLGILATCVWWAFAQRQTGGGAIRRLLFFGVVWYAITIAPMVVTYVSARHLYIPAAGLSIALAALVLSHYPAESPSKRRVRIAMAGTLLVLYAIPSIARISVWVANGRDSYRFASSIPRLLQTVPRGSVVLVEVRDRLRDNWFWSWATPFALEPPFTSEDLNEAFKIVERPEVYCCPADRWWNARRHAVAALLDAPSAQQAFYISFAPDQPGAAQLNTRTVDGRALRMRLDAALGQPIDTATATAPDETKVTAVLFDQR
jgi:hypothetical protein